MYSNQERLLNAKLEASCSIEKVKRGSKNDSKFRFQGEEVDFANSCVFFFKLGDVLYEIKGGVDAPDSNHNLFKTISDVAGGSLLLASGGICLIPDTSYIKTKTKELLVQGYCSFILLY